MDQKHLLGQKTLWLLVYYNAFLPVNDDRVWWGFIAISTAFFLTASAMKRKWQKAIFIKKAYILKIY